VVITGDKHQNSVRNVPEDYRYMAGPAIATEFIGTSISSHGNAGRADSHGGDANNPHILFENFQRGYVKVDLDHEIWRTDFRVVDTVKRREDVPAHSLGSWMVQNGEPGAFPAAG
jgi:alkaline phosphatase D